MTAVWSIGVSAFAPLSAAAAPSAAAVAEGDLVKASLAAVYYIGDNGKRYVFPNEKTYRTWWSGFSSVKTISDAELAALAIGGNATYRPGAKLVKITTDPKVYVVGANGSLYAIDSEATAVELYGSNWNTLIDDVPDAFFTNYTVASGTVSANLGGLGVLPAGQFVKNVATGTVYLSGQTANYMPTGDLSVVKAMMMADDISEVESWIGSVAGAQSMDLNMLATPDRTGSLEGGDGGQQTSGAVTASVKQKSTGLLMSAGANTSQNVQRAVLDVCGNGQMLDAFSVSTAQGTVSATDMIMYAMINGLLYEQGSTTQSNTVVELVPTEGKATLSGCQELHLFAASSNTSGRTKLVMTQIKHSGSGAAATESVNLVTHENDNVSVSADQLADVAWSNATPAGGSTLQSDGNMQKVFGVQQDINNNDVYLPAFVMKAPGALSASGCELRRDGTKISDSYSQNGTWWTFEIGEANRVFEEGSDSMEVWCRVNGEAGQSVTPQLTWPAPGFHIYDNTRVKAGAAFNSNLELIAPAVIRTSVSVTSSLSISGASITAEVISLTKVTDNGVLLDDKKTSGTSNSPVAAYRVKVRGSRANLPSLTLAVSGANDDTGFSGCQVKIGMRKDGAEFSTTAVNTADFDLSNFGVETAINNDGGAETFAVNGNQNLEVGDHLLLVVCDITASANAYGNNDQLAMVLVAPGAAQVTFNTGGTATFPASNVTATTVTISLLTSITVAADGTTRFLVENGTNQLLGVYTITGPSQEGVVITSISMTFAVGVAGANACTSVTLKNASGTELATSQSLTGAGTLNFSVNISVAKNAQYLLHVVCVQTSSNVTAGTQAAATTLASISGTGQQSGQSFTANPATAGAQVNRVDSGTLTASQSTNKSNRVVGPNKELLVLEFSTTASIHEDQELTSLVITLAPANNASVNDLSTVRVAADGLTGSAAVSDICTRVVTGTVLTCTFSSDQLVLSAGQTATFFVYAKGNSFGNIAVAGGAAADTITTSIAAAATDINFKGQESDAAVNPAAATLTGRVLTPFASDFYLVKQSIPSTLLAGQTNMDLFHMDLVVSGSTVILNSLGITCTTNDAGAPATVDGTVACDDNDTADLEIDSTIVATQTLATRAATLTPVGGTTLTVGTHAGRLLVDSTGCGNNETVQINLATINYTASDGTNTDTIQGETVTEPFNAAPGNIVTGFSNLCG